MEPFAGSGPAPASSSRTARDNHRNHNARRNPQPITYPQMTERSSNSPFHPSSSSRLPSPPPTAATASPAVYTGRHDSIAQRGLLDNSAPSSPSPRGSYTSAPKVLRYSYQSSQSSQSSTPIAHPPRAHVNDPEKRGSHGAAPSHSARSYYERDCSSRGDECALEDPVELKEKAFRIMLYLSGPCFLLTIPILLWTIASLLLVLILTPFHLISGSKSSRTQLIDFLAPPLRLQLSLIESSVREDTYSGYSAPLLVIVHLFAPAVGLGVAISSWISGVFWFYTAILGDPDGSDKPRGAYGKEYNDGQASVLAVRAFWKKWLIRALR